MFQNLLVLAVTCLSLSNDAFATDTNYRLNTPIVPSDYQILITPYFDTGDANQFTFDGTVSIQFTTTAVTNQIKLHSQDLTFSPDSIVVAVYNTANTIALTATNGLEFNTNYTFAYINLVSNLVTGTEYVLQIKYKGSIRTDLNGFYRNHYFQNGVKKWLGATQMEPTHARKVFPCFDEPELKATFVIGIDRPANYQPSLSNTEIERTETLANGYVREVFFKTPRMATYLVAFLVSEFEAAAFSQNGTQEFGVFTRPDAKNQSEYAFQFGKKVVDALGTYFGINYYSTNSHLRLDHVALPDFRAGAMENWGLIKYREALLLYVPEESTPYFKYRVAQIVAHETTHMWFGNLVTCHWWSNTWLNEGFANYFQDYITTFVDPEVGAANQLVIGSVYSAYDADNSPISPPITNNNVNSPAEISGHFGTITYQKAGSVIRMMHHLIQDDAFKYGLNFYLTNNSFSSGYPEKLYQGLNEGIRAYNSLSSYPYSTIDDVMSSWITQAGHPVVTVYIDYETDVVTLTQERYYVNGSLSSNETYKIPITYTTQASPDFENTAPVFIMDEKVFQFKIPNISQNHSWAIFNVQETGLYRVNYGDNLWTTIISALKGNNSKVIHPLNRAKIINDLFAFVYSDEVPFATLYSALDSLQGETEYSVWYAALRGFSKIWHFYLGDTEALPSVEDFILRHLDYGISILGYEVKATDSFEDLRNRMQLLEFACKLEHSGCVEKTVALFKALRQNGTEVTPSLRPVVYCTGLRHGNEEDYEFLWNRMLSTNVANEVWVIEDALGCTSNEQMLKRYLASVAMADTPIRTQDQTVPLTSVLRTYGNLHIVMDALKSNYTLWSTIYPSMDTILSTVASVLHTESDFTEDFILRHLDYGISILGYEVKATDSFEDLRNRMQLLEFACKLEHSGCVEKTVALFKALRQNGTEVTPSLRPVVYCTGLRHGNEEDYEFLWNRMLSTNVANEVWVIEDALGCTSNEQMLKRYLASVAMADTPIRTQDQTVPLTSVLRTYGNLHIVMDALKSNYTLWSTIYPSMDTILSTVASVLHTESDFTEFESFLSSCTECTEASKTAARSSLVQSRATASWANSHKAEILKSIKTSGSYSASTVPSIIMIMLGFAVLLFTKF